MLTSFTDQTGPISRISTARKPTESGEDYKDGEEDEDGKSKDNEDEGKDEDEDEEKDKNGYQIDGFVVPGGTVSLESVYRDKCIIFLWCEDFASL